MKNLTSLIKPKTAVKLLKFLLIFYITFCLVVAFLNFVVAEKTNAEAAYFIHKVYEFFENELKTTLIIVCSFFSFYAFPNIAKRKLYKLNLVGFICSAVIIHVILPLLTGNRAIYYTAMPLPWSTIGLQLMAPDSSFYVRHIPLWGLSGISAAVVFFISMNIFIFIATLLFGRRVQCSMLCLINGFAAEIWSAAFPLKGKKKKLSITTKKALGVFRLIMLLVSLSLSIIWLLYIGGIQLFENIDALAQFEVFKYLLVELMAAMVFWVFWTGRGYCHYCPLGTFLSLIAKLGKQHITTDITSCTGCGVCTSVCPMSIDVASSAKKREPVTDSLCVGCGHCVDACPVNTIKYETVFIQKVNKTCKFV